MPTQRSVPYAGRRILYTLTRKRVKNLNLRIRRDGSVAVSAPAQVSASRIDAFVLSKAPMILAAQEKIQEQTPPDPEPRQYRPGEQYPYLGGFLTLRIVSGPQDSVFLVKDQLLLTMRDPENGPRRARLVEKALDDLCRQVFLSALADVYPPFEKLGVPMPELKIRRMKSRWGTCFYTKGTITLNRQLLAAPLPCIQCVAAHELCHFRVPNHSAAFYALLTAVFPDWRAQQRVLKDNAARWL